MIQGRNDIVLFKAQDPDIKPDRDQHAARRIANNGHKDGRMTDGAIAHDLREMLMELPQGVRTRERQFVVRRSVSSLIGRDHGFAATRVARKARDRECRVSRHQALLA